MAIIYSTDNGYRKNVRRAGRFNANTVRFVLHAQDGTISQNAGQAVFSADIARRCFGGRKCVLGYDDEKNEILVIPKIDGNISIGQAGAQPIYESKVYTKISMKQFLRFIGLKDEDFPEGKYPCEIDDEDVVHVFLDRMKKEDK